MARVLRQQSQRATQRATSTRTRTAKPPAPSPSPAKPPTPPPTANLASQKWTSYRRYDSKSPYPDFHAPSPSACARANHILTKLHGPRDPLASNAMTADGVARPSAFPDVLHGLLYGVLCQATNEGNAIRQVQSLNTTYGSWMDLAAIAAGGEDKLKDALACGGLHERKARMIIRILQQVGEKRGDGGVEQRNGNGKRERERKGSESGSDYTLNHLFNASDEDAMQELLSLYGVGPKTASCVLALTLQRQRFVVDTHIHRITGQLGWRPAKASAEQARAHLEARIPEKFKYSLHLLFITHGRECARCRAGGDRGHDCELMRNE